MLEITTTSSLVERITTLQSEKHPKQKGSKLLSRKNPKQNATKLFSRKKKIP